MLVSVRDLKARLSEFLRLARRGEEVVITHRGVPVGRVVGLDAPARERSSEGAADRLRRLPWIRPAVEGGLSGAREPLPHRSGEPTLADMVAEDRG
jgi:prevent-host-death family protein